MIDRNNPTFVLLSVNNNRTAWRPVSLPVILAVPRRDINGAPVNNSDILNLSVLIENVPNKARVAGHDHIGVLYPDRELYRRTIGKVELSDYVIDLGTVTITRNGATVDLASAVDGDTIEYTTASGIRDTFTYYSGTYYYDLSSVSLDIEQLPDNDYNLVYQANYYKRVITSDGRDDFICVDVETTNVAILKFKIRHPGQVMSEFYRLTPPPYITDSSKANDTTVALYRPFTDSLQNIADESDLLESLNWVYDISPAMIPYLSSMLGWDLPYFPDSLDNMRRAIIRRTVEFQNLKGSKRAIVEIFKLFGLDIIIKNLWWSDDGESLITPGETSGTQITIEEKCQADILLMQWDSSKDGSVLNSSKFGSFNIPLLFRPQITAGLDGFDSPIDGGDVTVDVYLVETGSAADNILKTISEEIYADPSEYCENTTHIVDSNGFITVPSIDSRVNGVAGHVRSLISGPLGKSKYSVSYGDELPVNDENIILDRTKNVLTVTLNGAASTSNRSVYAFAFYKKQSYIVPETLSDLQSNRFDIQILSGNLSEIVDPTILEFAIEFLYKLKAFHSQLNTIRQRISLSDVYLVTDFCVGGDTLQRYDTDAGMLHTPPAITPQIPADASCSGFGQRDLGYSEYDINLRSQILESLEEEHAAWKALDGRLNGTIESKVETPQPNGSACQYTHLGQDRIIQNRIEGRGSEYGPHPNTNGGDGSDFNNFQLSSHIEPISGDFDPTGPETSSSNDTGHYGQYIREYTENNTKLCELDGSDYCYKGRAGDEILHLPSMEMKETYRSHPCSVSIGAGVYWTYPSKSKIVVNGTAKPAVGSRSPKTIYSGGATQYGQSKFLDGHNEYLSVSYDTMLPNKNNSLLGRLYRDYDTPSPETIHYTNRQYKIDFTHNQNLALSKPDLGIQKATMHLPGCRFPMMNALTDDFVSVWPAKPWDYDVCGPNYCDSDPSFLNYEIVGEQLRYDSAYYSISANGLTPDVTTLGEHTITMGESSIVHKVYMKDATLNPIITLDQVCPYGTDGNVISVSNPLFPSYAECGTGYVDYADGYACDSGQLTYDGTSWYDDDIMIALGVPMFDDTDQPTLYFMMGSGILSESAIRMDCGCLLAPCSGTEETTRSTICASDAYLDDDGNYDWDPSYLTVDSRMVLNDSINSSNVFMNGAVTSMLELL